MFLLFGVIFLIVSLLLLGLFVLLRSTSALNISFALFAFITATWVAVNFVGSNFKSFSHATYFIYADFLLGPIVGLSFGIFAILLGSQVAKYKVDKIARYILYAMTVVCVSLSLSHATFVVIQDGNQVSISYGDLYDLYSVLLGSIFLMSISFMFLSWRKANGDAKRQLKTLLTGLTVAVLFVISANVVVPQLTDSEIINLAAGNLSYTSIVFFAALVAFTIIKHKLFDIRPVIARSVGYLFSLTFLGIIYGITAFYLVDDVLFSNESLNASGRRSIYIALALLSGLIFAPSKRVFDRLSNKLFYRDAYDPEVFIDQFTTISVSNSNISKLMTEAAALIRGSLKASYVDFVLKLGNNEMMGMGLQRFTSEQIQQIFHLLGETKGQVIDVDEQISTKNGAIGKLLKRQDVVIITKLTNHDELIGFVFIGAKQSGNIFNHADKEMFGIVADELSLAIENSLSYEEIRKFNETLQGEVDDATRQLRHSNEKLKALDETKDEFISMASHQLRTPLTSVKGYLSMVLEGDAGELNEQQKKLLNQAFTSSQRMVYLIADLLNVSRLHTGKFVIEVAPTHLPEVIEGEIGQLYETAGAKGLKLTFDKPADFPVLKLDETKIRQVIMNFVDNAIYYTPMGGKIRIELEAKRESIEFRVVDTGLGVPRAEQRHLFTKFYRADNARRARPDGTGLGLFMAKKVVIAQGGAIIFKSVEGKGSTFGFTFPRHKLEIKP